MTTIDEAKAVGARHRTELETLPNVTGVGVGREAGEIVVKVYVSRKVLRESLPESEQVPEEIEGIPTVVEVLAPLKAR